MIELCLTCNNYHSTGRAHFPLWHVRCRGDGSRVQVGAPDPEEAAELWAEMLDEDVCAAGGTPGIALGRDAPIALVEPVDDAARAHLEAERVANGWPEARRVVAVRVRGHYEATYVGEVVGDLDQSGGAHVRGAHTPQAGPGPARGDPE